MRPHVGWYLAVAGWLRGQVAEAEDSLVRITTEQQAAGERYLAVRPACDLGQVRQARGHLDGALHAYNQALEIATEAGRPLPPAGMAHLGMAEVLYQRDDLDAAARHATEGVALCRQLAYTQPLATGLAALAWIRQAQGDREGALETMAEAERVAPGPGLAGVLNPVPAQRARLLLAQGDVAEAARWADERGLSADDEPSYPSEPEHLVLARLLLAQIAPARRSPCWSAGLPRQPPAGARQHSSTPDAAGAGAGGQRGPGQGAECPGGCALLGLPARLRPRVRRRGRGDGRPARSAGGCTSRPA